MKKTETRNLIVPYECVRCPNEETIRENRTMSSFHKTNLGSFGENLTTDMDGFAHTTIAGWMSANVDFAGERMTRKQLRDWARGQATESREQLANANAGLAEWRAKS